jgi:quercetin dioxygenase-like cupin family protein
MEEGMTFQVRRVVTGHDAAGNGVVKIDDTVAGVSIRPGAASCVVWMTDTSPADINSDEDMAKRPVGTAQPDGTVFRIVEYGPGVAPRIHRTDSIDYIIILSGEIYMDVDGKGTEVLLKAGDVVVQRGNLHNWIVRGPEKCVLAAVLIDAKPVVIDGKRLAAHG